jgi:CBS domain containing-hemolysin-like protein
MAAAARGMVEHLDAYIAACQLGITMASLALGWIGEPALAHLVEPLLAGLLGEAAVAVSHGVAVGLSFGAITALHIVLGELAPKGLALQKTEATALWVTPGMRLFYTLFRWPIHALNAVGNGVLRLAGLHPASGHEGVHSVEELRLLVTSMEQAGVVDASEARIASRAFHFGDVTAGAVMTPRTEIDAVPVTADREALYRLARSGRRSRVLVYGDTLDDVLGVLYVRDLFQAFEAPPERFSLRPWVRPVLFTPDSRSADEVLDAMRSQRRQLAVVTDEFGGTAGLVTLQDLAGALVGRVEDEGDRARPTEQADADGSLVLDGLLRLEEVEEMSGLRVASAWHGTVETLGGLVMASLGRVPAVGDTVVLDGHTLRVEGMEGRRVARVRLSRGVSVSETPPIAVGGEAGAATEP